MSIAITAKVKCTAKVESGEGDGRQAVVTFAADYQDGRNKEWSLYTPCLHLEMTLRGDVADQFEQDGRYTLTFTPDEDASSAPAAGEIPEPF